LGKQAIRREHKPDPVCVGKLGGPLDGCRQVLLFINWCVFPMFRVVPDDIDLIEEPFQLALRFDPGPKEDHLLTGCNLRQQMHKWLRKCSNVLRAGDLIKVGRDL
jgi:hypothetical protein